MNSDSEKELGILRDAMLSDGWLSTPEQALGCYQGEEEDSYMIALDGDQQSIDWQLSTLVELGKAYKQECILFVDEESNASLIYCKDFRWESLGKWQEVDEWFALLADAYTVDPATNSYFMAI